MATVPPVAAAASPASAGPTVYTRDYKETSITVWWQASQLPPSTVSVAIFAREFPQPWPAAPRATFPVDAATTSYVVEGLSPTSTFEFKLQCKLADGKTVEGPPASADTLAAGCTPKDEKEKKKGCAIA